MKKNGEGVPAGADSGSLLGPFCQVRVLKKALKTTSGAETVSKGRNIYSTGGLFHGATPWHASDLRFEKVYRFSSSFGASGFRRDIFKGHLYTVFLRGYEPRGGVPAGRISRRSAAYRKPAIHFGLSPPAQRKDFRPPKVYRFYLPGKIRLICAVFAVFYQKVDFWPPRPRFFAG